MINNNECTAGVYVAHDLMGCPRHIGSGAIFERLAARNKAETVVLEYFSFYVVNEKKRQRETLPIRVSPFLLKLKRARSGLGLPQ
jgi:hypothetical protein